MRPRRSARSVVVGSGAVFALNIAREVVTITTPKSTSRAVAGMWRARRPPEYAPATAASPKMAAIFQRTAPARACITVATALVVPTTNSEVAIAVFGSRCST